jgi:hypothetical protein
MLERPPQSAAAGQRAPGPVIFLQFDAGTPQSEVWRGLNGAATFRADCG